MESSQLSYSPSQTMDYLKCPTFWRFRKLWSPRSPWTPHMHVGAALSNALAVFRLAPTEEGYASALEAARVKLEQRCEDIDSPEWSFEGLFKLVEKGFAAAVKKTVAEELETEDVIGTETTIGAGRVDYISKVKSTGDLMVTDDKVKLQLRADWVNRTLVETEQDWQLWDYAWRVSEYYGQTVKYIRRHLIVLSPRANSFHQTFTLTKEAIEQWFKSAQLWWGDMAQDEEAPITGLEMRTPSCIKPWKCEFFDACHTLFRDESKMGTLYDSKKRS